VFGLCCLLLGVHIAGCVRSSASMCVWALRLPLLLQYVLCIQVGVHARVGVAVLLRTSVGVWGVYDGVRVAFQRGRVCVCVGVGGCVCMMFGMVGVLWNGAAHM
jgi:hypothetical protein